MKEEYNISRYVLAIVAALVFAFLYKDIAPLYIIIPLVIAPVTFVASFPSTIISKKIINTGEKINNWILRILYYIALLIGTVLFSYIILNILSITIERNINGLSPLLIPLLIIEESICVVIVLPYVQSLIVLLIRFINNSKPRE